MLMQNLKKVNYTWYDNGYEVVQCQTSCKILKFITGKELEIA